MLQCSSTSIKPFHANLQCSWTKLTLLKISFLLYLSNKIFICCHFRIHKHINASLKSSIFGKRLVNIIASLQKNLLIFSPVASESSGDAGYILNDMNIMLIFAILCLFNRRRWTMTQVCVSFSFSVRGLLQQTSGAMSYTHTFIWELKQRKMRQNACSLYVQYILAIQFSCYKQVSNHFYKQ